MFHKILFNGKWLLAGALACCGVNELSAGTLTGSFAAIAAGSNVDLTLGGKLDWVHWGLYTETSVNRKSYANVEIGDFTPVLDSSNPNGFVQVYQFADNANGYTWHDGQPVGSITNTTTGVWAYGIPNLGSGFEFSVPADTTQRTLQVFLGVFSGRGTFQANLSDNSLVGYTNSSLANLLGNGPGGVYTLNYSADSAGQSLNIRWTLTQAAGANAASANVTLQGATLTAPGANNPPLVTITNPVDLATYASPANVAISAVAEDFDGTVTNVAFFAGTSQLGERATRPYNFTWMNPSVGHYYLTAVAMDNLGGSRSSPPIEIYVYGSGGSLSGEVSDPPPVLDLTQEGTADWVHWGLVNKDSVDRKSGVVAQISDFVKLGTGAIQQYSDNYTVFSWSDGTPTPTSNGTMTGVFVTGLGDGFQLTAPADTNPRQLRVYVGGYGFQGELQAWLSDLSAPPYVDASVINVYGNSYLVYTCSYRAASAGQQMNVVWRSLNLFDQSYGNVTLQAATLQDGPAELLPVYITNAACIGSEFLLSFNTQTNHNYILQFTDLLPPSGWTDVTTVPGSGAMVTVTNQSATNGERYYRVKIE